MYLLTHTEYQHLFAPVLPRTWFCQGLGPWAAVVSDPRPSPHLPPLGSDHSGHSGRDSVYFPSSVSQGEVPSFPGPRRRGLTHKYASLSLRHLGVSSSAAVACALTTSVSSRSVLVVGFASSLRQRRA